MTFNEFLQQKDVAQLMLDNGMTRKEIAHHFGVPQSHVTRLRLNNDIPRQRYIEKVNSVKILRKLSYSRTEIAERLGINKQTVSHYSKITCPSPRHSAPT
jgi:DNA-directed RNA polymerase specialized sigma subunit